MPNSSMPNNNGNEANQAYRLSTPEDIYGAIRKIVLMGSNVEIKIDDEDTVFHSAITDTNLEAKSFFMDKVLPASGNDLIRSGKRFTIGCDSQGVHIEFRADGRMRYQPEEEQYRIEYPDSVIYLQRRTAYRVSIPPAHQILLKIRLSDDEAVIGRLIDLSSSGFRALFEGDIRATLEKRREFNIARVRFNRDNTIDCSIEARHIVLNARGNTLCGFSFAMISPIAQRYLDRLITEFQWEERRLKEQQQRELSDD